MDHQKYEQQIVFDMLEEKERLDQLGDSIRSAAKMRKPLPVIQKEALKQISNAVTKAQLALPDDPTDDVRLSNATLNAIAEALRSVHTTLDDLILHASISS